MQGVPHEITPVRFEVADGATSLVEIAVPPIGIINAIRIEQLGPNQGGRFRLFNKEAAALAVTEGGTGVATLTGIVKASGTSAFSAASAGTDYVAPGAATSSGLTMATARLVGRTTASTGALEEITVGSGLALSSGTLSSAVGAMDSINKQQYFQGL